MIGSLNTTKPRRSCQMRVKIQSQFKCLCLFTVYFLVTPACLSCTLDYRFSKTARKRDNLRGRLSSAPSIEETGLDLLLYGEGLPFLAPRDTLRKTSSTPSEFLKALAMQEPTSAVSRRDSYFDALDVLPKHKNAQNEGVRKRRGQNQQNINGFFREEISITGGDVEGNLMSVDGGQVGVKGKDPRGSIKFSNVSEEEEEEDEEEEKEEEDEEEDKSMLLKDYHSDGSSGKGIHVLRKFQPLAKHESIVPQKERSLRFRGRQYLAAETYLRGIEEEDIAEPLEEVDSLDDNKPLANVKEDLGGKEDSGCAIVPTSLGMLSKQTSSEDTSPAKGENDLVKATTSDVKYARTSVPKLGLKRISKGVSLHTPPGAETLERSSDSGDITVLQSPPSRLEARNRWRRVKHTLAFTHHMSQNVKSGSGDFLEQVGEEQMTQEQNARGDTGRAGAAAFEGAKIRGQFRAKGRKGMEGMLVRQDKGIITLVQDFYVACLKMPIGHFLIGVFLAPIALGLLFTPIYLLGKGGLAFDGVTLSEATVVVGRVAAARKRVSALVNVFLYALSLSTTFGGSPVAALSPYTLCVANVNTLMGQFLFVFLSGAVFARMSQPSQPIRCSRKAIIRSDFTSTSETEPKEQSKIFAVRLVLTGPPPCELVDAKICLTFRIFIKLPSGSMFCSTQDLDLVRPEVSYLRYGIMVRHIIDHKSPVYGHTIETLLDGDASFSLTVMGLERTSMQPIFHLEDYFVCDGDVAWDADYIDFIHINKQGHRVLDHSKIDQIKITPETKMPYGSEGKKGQGRPENQTPLKGWRARGLGKANALHAKSTSFTRADW